MNEQWRQGRDFFFDTLNQVKETVGQRRREPDVCRAFSDDAAFFAAKKSVVDKVLPGLRELAGRWAELPQTFEPEFYQSLYPQWDQGKTAKEHYRDEGALYGELTSPIVHMLGLTGFLMNDASVSRVLEIGPYAHPVDLGSGVTIKRFDILDRRGLVERLEKAGDGRQNPNNVPFIDYVSPDGDLSVVTEQFDAIYSAHCLEHTTDLLRHLRGATALLRPGGRYYLVIPDHRRCSDRFYPQTDINQVLAAEAGFPCWVHYATAYCGPILTTHNNHERHWRGDHFNNDFLSDFEGKLRRLEERLETNHGTLGRDAHHWRFSPASFMELLSGLKKSGRLEIEVKRVCHTSTGRCEFTAVLEKPARAGSPPQPL